MNIGIIVFVTIFLVHSFGPEIRRHREALRPWLVAYTVVVGFLFTMSAGVIGWELYRDAVIRESVGYQTAQADIARIQTAFRRYKGE